MAEPSTFPLRSIQQDWDTAPPAFDVRTLGMMLARVLDELNRPDLQSQAISYIQDAVRRWRRRSFFFNDRDNMRVGRWHELQYYTMGATIRTAALTDGRRYAMVCVVPGNGSATTEPTWTTDIYQTSTMVNGRIVTGTLGTFQDNEVLWANAGLFSGPMGSADFAQDGDLSSFWTQLSTVPGVNQYTPPLDFISLNRFEVTSQNFRIQLAPRSYQWIRDQDVLRPGPPTIFPTDYAYYEQQFYLWAYPNSFYPLTLSYRGAAPVPVNLTDSNYWTTEAEALIRTFAKGKIELEVIHDQEAAQACFSSAKDEFLELMRHGNAQHETSGVPPEPW